MVLGGDQFNRETVHWFGNDKDVQKYASGYKGIEHYMSREAQKL